MVSGFFYLLIYFTHQDIHSPLSGLCASCSNDLMSHVVTMPSILLIAKNKTNVWKLDAVQHPSLYLSDSPQNFLTAVVIRTFFQINGFHVPQLPFLRRYHFGLKACKL